MKTFSTCGKLVLTSVYIAMIEAVTKESVGAETKAITELEQPRWAVISFDRCEAGNLSYENAANLLTDLEAKGITGLCVVTDQTAARLAV